MALLFAAYLRIPNERTAARVTLVLPLTGPSPSLEELLAALADQSVRPRRLIVAVESREDPAFARVAALGGHYAGSDIELVVAGLSSVCSQKCANLLAALMHLDDSDAHVVFLDADIRPQLWWLAALVAPLAAGRADIVNGYRWQIPKTLSPAAVMVAAIDHTIAIQPRLSQARAIWGGSLALTRSALEILDLPATIGRTLTEDLPIGDRAKETGLRVLTRRALRVPTPLDGRSQDLWRFGRRQHQLIRLYRPGLWSYAAFVVTTGLGAQLVLLETLIAAGRSSGPVAGRIKTMPATGPAVGMRSFARNSTTQPSEPIAHGTAMPAAIQKMVLRKRRSFAACAVRNRRIREWDGEFCSARIHPPPTARG